MSTNFVIGVDSSTTSCKAIAWDAQGRALAEGRGGRFALLSPEPNFYEQHAEDWWQALCAALRDLGNKIDVAGAHKILDVHGFLVHRLMGQFKTSLACADPMGLVDMRRGMWADELMCKLGLREEQFAALARPGEVMGEITAQAASATGLPAGLPVVAGAGQCAGLGANALGKDRAYLNLGTAVIGGFYSPTYLTDSWYRTMGAPVPQGYFLENCLHYKAA